MTDFDADSLPAAITRLFELNHYQVDGPFKLNGAEIDLKATPVGAPFSTPIYIEATIQYVDTAKYGKDLTKLAMVQRLYPSAICLIVSSSGFTLEVRERAKDANVTLATYAELFKRFERFQPYIEMMTGESPQALSLTQLSEVYEAPSFDDSLGTDNALDWMDAWLTAPESSMSWLIITGEYGTGKSALTRMLQKRWLTQYGSNAASPIPIRIELGNFTKQFDAQGLLHHFLDHNNLGHVPIEFFWSLVRSGRVVLILDGYDEMAQYLSQRERRQTLKALAELSGDGARGILTSRPNYFSETEELALYDHLYRELSLRSRFAVADGVETQKREQQVDELIQRSILDRFERSLRDLSPEQSRALVRNTLKESPSAADTVIRLLDRVFRSTGEGTEVALSGKPVIISYLIDVASSLQETADTRLSEWEVYTLIIDKLALRDMEHTARVRIDERRKFLQSFAVELTKTGSTGYSEDQFRMLVEKEFRTSLRRYTGQMRVAEVDALFDDLRRSGTLTRSADAAGNTWKFSHNSLREFLVAERMIDELSDGKPLLLDPPVTDAMRTLVKSRPEPVKPLLETIAAAWSDTGSNPAVGSYLSLIWDASTKASFESPFATVAGIPPQVQHVQLSDLVLSSVDDPKDYVDMILRDCAILRVAFHSAVLQRADFSGSILEAVIFDDADLRDATFDGAAIVDVSFAGANLQGARFENINDDASIIVDGSSNRERLEGSYALGYLAFHGAVVGAVDDYFSYSHHARFPIVAKVAAKLLEGGPVQRHGLESRGAAATDPVFAHQFVKHLEGLGYAETPFGRSYLIQVTPAGRTALATIVAKKSLPAGVSDFLRDN